MFWLGTLLIALIILLPTFYGLRRTRPHVDARASALALYRGQLTELDRDHTLGLLNTEEHAAARLEIQRRLLSADANSAAPDLLATHTRKRQTFPFIAVSLGLPLLAFTLYILNGHPSLPPMPLSARQTTPNPQSMALIHTLQNRVATIPKDSPQYATGHTLLGQIEAREGLIPSAITDWTLALNAHFTPELALQLAELQSQQDGHISASSLDLYRRALAAAPADASWRMAVEARIAVGEHEENNAQ